MRLRSLAVVSALVMGAANFVVWPALALEAKRIALIIGNSAYENVTPLTNPANDATDIGQKLKSLGFDVLLATNASQEKMLALLLDFKNRVTHEHVALVFFAGHGVTVNNESFLVPVDSPVEIDLDERGDARAASVNKQLVGMASVLAPLEAAKIGILFLDACRTSAVEPTELSLRVVSLQSKRAVPILRGTASSEIKPSPYSAGVFRAYATQLNNAASDGAGRNSPFTKALLANIATKGITIQELMIRVRKAVMKETGNQQIPWEEAALNESFYFVPQPVAAALPARTSTPAPRGPANRSNGVGGGARPGGVPTITGIQ